MADKYTGLYDGASDSANFVINALVAGAIFIGSPVVPTTAGTGEKSPRVTTDTSGTAFVAGVVVGGSSNGIWVDGTTTNDGLAGDAAGVSVKVCTRGRCKVRVDGSTGGANSNIAIGDPLSCGIAATAQRAVAADFVFARALQASTAVADAILCDVTLEGIL